MYKKMRPNDGPRDFVQVDKIDKHIDVIKKAGGNQLVEKIEIPGMGYSFNRMDPEGNVIALFEAISTPRRRVRGRK